MSEHETSQQLQPELNRRKEALQDDFAQLKRKVQETREQLSPTKFVAEHRRLLCGIALILGGILGYRGVPISDLAKPAVRSTLSAAGKQSPLRAIGG